MRTGDAKPAGGLPRGQLIAAIAAVTMLVALAVVFAARDDSSDRSLDRERSRRRDTATSLGEDLQSTSSTPPSVSSGGAGTGGTGSSGGTLGTGGSSGTGGAGVAPPGSLALGSLQETGASQGCLAGATQCRSFEITCPGLSETARGEIDVRAATSQARGVAVFFSHAKGGSWWGESLRNNDFIDQLRAGGITMVQVRWVGGSWLESAPGEQAGTSKVACRPATAIKWVHDTVFVPLGVDAGPLRCGFCITGVSGGASQVAYPLGYFGLDSILDAVVPVSGPPHGDQAKGCLRRAGESGYWYEDPSHVLNIDLSYGFRSADGPCARHDTSWVARWDAESVARGAPDYAHPNTRIHFLIGGRDESPAPSHAQAYAAALRSQPSNHVTVDVDPTMPHGLNESGFDALLATLLA